MNEPAHPLMFTLTGSDRERFWSHMIKGPEPDDCWLWVGAIADDGYGRFWTRHRGRQQVLRPQRVAYALITGRELTEDVMLLHWCDVPLCVHADADPAISHVREGTNRDNMLDRSHRGRYAGPSTTLSQRGIARQQRAQRSRDLRTVLLEHGWNRERMAAAAADIDDDQPALF
ncbi:hypothetical protein [Rathayibacter rathayi]|uniref:hypothetical protein n=1 Tax=Rathayibacter rathayi TaxID=33887 RepID=UPI0021587C56|nr:hypothetical protein [Rathayibacter rathayi]